MLPLVTPNATGDAAVSNASAAAAATADVIGNRVTADAAANTTTTPQPVLPLPPFEKVSNVAVNASGTATGYSCSLRSVSLPKRYLERKLA